VENKALPFNGMYKAMNENVLEQLQSCDRIEMWEAVKILVKENDVSVVPIMMDLVATSMEPERRVAAIWALGALRRLEALTMLIQILVNKSEPAELRDHAAEALGYISDNRARPALIANLVDENADVAFSCVFALRTVGLLDDIPYLAEIARRSRMVNSYGAFISQEALGAIEQIKERFKREDASWTALGQEPR
jgi:HEAT repeat protein